VRSQVGAVRPELVVGTGVVDACAVARPQPVERLAGALVPLQRQSQRRGGPTACGGVCPGFEHERHALIGRAHVQPGSPPALQRQRQPPVLLVGDVHDLLGDLALLARHHALRQLDEAVVHRAVARPDPKVADQAPAVAADVDAKRRMADLDGGSHRRAPSPRRVPTVPAFTRRTHPVVSSVTGSGRLQANLVSTQRQRPREHR
jgi:hypothetical protein